MESKKRVKINLFIVWLVVVNVSPYIAASFWDSIPVIAQVKSLVQVIGGDEKGARETQENFLKQGPGVSQLYSLGQAMAGDTEGAKKTQETFLHDTLEPLADNTPVVGHVKGIVHLATGDEKRGLEIVHGANAATAMAAGGIVGGPAGAIGAGVAYDTVHTGVESVVSNDFKPQGFINYAANIDKHSVGDHFDTWTDLLYSAQN